MREARQIRGHHLVARYAGRDRRQVRPAPVCDGKGFPLGAGVVFLHQPEQLNEIPVWAWPEAKRLLGGGDDVAGTKNACRVASLLLTQLIAEGTYQTDVYRHERFARAVRAYTGPVIGLEPTIEEPVDFADLEGAQVKAALAPVILDDPLPETSHAELIEDGGQLEETLQR